MTMENVRKSSAVLSTDAGLALKWVSAIAFAPGPGEKSERGPGWSQ
jgi:hypothetical protein